MSMPTRRLLDHARVVTMTPATGYGLIDDGALLVRGNTIEWVGCRAELPMDIVGEAERIDCGGRLLTPALIDCHTSDLWR